jgi:hypothetical protein
MCLQIPDLVFDVPAHYAFHRALLQTLQHGRAAATWLLKTPAHLATLPQLFATYPDAWIVQTHRDPVKTMPSTVSTTAMVQWMRSDHVDVERLAGAIDLTFGAALLAVIEQRAGDALPERFVDVHYRGLVEDPVFGTHRYTAEEWGFEPDELRRRLSPYIDHYGVALE